MNILLVTFLKENSGGVFVFFCATGIAIWVACFITKTKINIETLNKNFEDLKGDLKEDFKGLKEDFKDLKGDFKDSKERLEEIYMKIISNSTIASSSPMSLTELGQKISGNINAKALAKKYIKTLKEGSTSSDNLSAFVIQTKSMEFANKKLMDNFSSDEKNQVQNEAFQQGLKIEKILEIIGMELRDIWLNDEGLDVPTSTGGQV